MFFFGQILYFSLKFQRPDVFGLLHCKCSTSNSSNNPAGTQRPEDVPLWSCLGRNVLDHFRTKIGGITYLTYFGTAMSDKPLELGNRRKFPEKLSYGLLFN